MNGSLLKINPVVCCVADRYIICIPAPEEALISVLIEGQVFTCDDNGVRKSGCGVHKIEVPMNLLDAAGSYTVLYEKMLHRKPYRSELAPPFLYTFAFRAPRDQYPLRIAHLSDVHGLEAAAVQTGVYFNSDLDLLILNGDISSSSNNLKESLLPLRIAYQITKGEVPCIITRGNHDLRGKYAEKLSEIYPTDDGRMYYTVRFPSVRFLVLDCGEDKEDTHEEYGGTAAFHSYRQRQTAFLEDLCGNADFCGSELPLIVLSHIPFPHTDGAGEFAIEQPLYAEWCRLIRENLNASFGLFGHHHRIDCLPAGDDFDTKKIGCPMMIGGKPVDTPVKDVYAAFLTLNKHDADVVFSNKKHQILKTDKISF